MQMPMNLRWSIALPPLALGCSGIVAQTVLLREMLVLCAGNEFSIGIVLGCWVLFGALGAAGAGRWLAGAASRPEFFAWLALLAGLTFPLAIWLVRTFRQLVGIAPDVPLGPGMAIIAACVVLLPVALPNGLLFTSACALRHRLQPEGRGAAGRVYLLDTCGTMAGGLSVSFLLIPSLDSFQIAVWMLPVLAGGAFGLFAGFSEGRQWAAAAVVMLLLIWFTALAGGWAARLHRHSIARQWSGKEVVAYRNSHYQNLVVTRLAGQYTFYSDGLPLLTTPDPDLAAIEEFVHLPLLTHSAPRHVLVLGGGAGGVLGEIGRYRQLAIIDYVEIDPLLLRMIRDFPTPLTSAELADPRLSLHYRDGVEFMAQPPRRYEVILLGSPLPLSLQLNRYFTREFFAMARECLAEGGIVACRLPGSETYYSRELARLNAGLLATLHSVFPQVTVIPGTENLYLAGGPAALLPPTPERLSARIAERGIGTRLLNPEYLAYRFDPGRSAWFTESLRDAPSHVNSTFAPWGLLDAMAYRNLMHAPWLNLMMAQAARPGVAPLLVGLAGLFLIVCSCPSRGTSLVVPAAVAATGFSAMLLELVLMGGFQAFFGSVYHQLGLLLALFMGGMTVGSSLALRLLEKGAAPGRLFHALEMGLASYALLIALLLSWFGTRSAGGDGSIYALFLVLLSGAGLLAGAQFPVAMELQGRPATQGGGTARFVARNAGRVYGADLAGGAVGGLLGGVLLLPTLGMVGSALLLGALKGMTLLAVLRGVPGRVGSGGATE